MPRLFRKKNQNGDVAGDIDQHDDMTITSGWSMGGSSVSDRIMGRMKMNLSFRNNGGSSARNINSSSSVGSGFSGGIMRSRSARNVHSTTWVDGGGGSSSQLAHGFTSADTSMSVAGVGAMEEMDSNEAMTLKGKSMGRRSSSRVMMRNLHGHSQRKLDTLENDNYEPVKYSLAELRSMTEDELETVMRDSGVSSEDISSTLSQAAKIDTSDVKIAEDQRKNLLVALFLNSGHVRLVPNNSNTGERRTAPSSPKSDSARDSFPSNNDDSNEDWRPSTRSDNIRDTLASSTASVDASSIKSSGSKDKSRKSKLEKIAELKTENSEVKRENKSLKKTVKKLLGKLSDSIDDKEELQKMLDEGVNDETKGNAKIPQDAEDDTKTTSSQQPPYDVVVHDGVGSTKSKGDCGSRRSTNSGKSLSKKFSYLKRKYRKEKEAHQNTEFRLKAEIDILTKEVDGLQRELGLSLEANDKAKKRARESRESMSNLKHELRNTSKKVKELTAEAEARDKLIETFSKILLQKVGLEDGGGNGGLSVDNSEGLEEEKIGDRVMIGQMRMEESLGKIKLPTSDFDLS